MHAQWISMRAARKFNAALGSACLLPLGARPDADRVLCMSGAGGARHCESTPLTRSKEGSLQSSDSVTEALVIITRDAVYYNISLRRECGALLLYSVLIPVGPGTIRVC